MSPFLGQWVCPQGRRGPWSDRSLPAAPGSHTCSLWGSQGSADALILYLARSRQRAQDGSPGASRLRGDLPAGPCPAAPGSAEHRGPAPRLVSRRRVARRLSCDLRAEEKSGAGAC